MDFLSPAKLLVIAVVALAVLGPDKLPAVAKQVSSLWRDFSRFRAKLESEVRGSFPDLPSTEAITKAVRSPLAYLDTLADGPGPVEGAAAPDASKEASGVDRHEPEAVTAIEFDPSVDVHWPAETVTGSVVAEESVALVAPSGPVLHEVRSDAGLVPADPGSN